MGENSKIATENFIERARHIHGNRYDYSSTQYKNRKSSVKIICPKHGEFEQIAYIHIKGHGCSKCYTDSKRVGTSEFIRRATSVHGDRYDYSLVDYKTSRDRVKIICHIHGEFIQFPQVHTGGGGCPRCTIPERCRINSIRQDYDAMARNVHGSRYDYSKTDFSTIRKKVTVTCRRHGDFLQKLQSHLEGKGCPKCSASIHEKRVIDLFDFYGIEYEYQKKFDDCVYRSVLYFDFFLPQYNLCIEVNGIQHKIPVNLFGGEARFVDTIERDSIKREYIRSSGIYSLLDIDHDQFKNIEKVIMEHLTINYNYTNHLKMVPKGESLNS